VVQGAMNDDEICTLAQEMFVDRIANYIAMYHNKLG
jgi:acetate kinase